MKRNMKLALSCAVVTWVGFSFAQMPVHAADAVYITANAAQEEAKYESQQKQIITSKDIEQKQAKSAEDIVFNETGVSRTVDAMGRVGVSIRGAEPRHTLILIDGQPALGDFAKYQGQGDELMRIGAENLDRIEIVQGASSAKYGSNAIGGVINVITKQPTKLPGMQFNMESLRLKGDKGIMPYSGFYLRANTGQVGNARFSIYGSKRDVLPVYATRARKQSIFGGDQSLFEKNSLRFFGESSNIGLSGIVDLNKNNNIEFKADRYVDNMKRFSKATTSVLAPEIHFKRDVKRNTYNLTWKGNTDNKNTDWKVELNYARMNEKDITLSNYEGHSSIFGNNELNYLDTIDHKQYDINTSVNHLVGDEHVVTFGVGFNKETGEGSRLRNAPTITYQKINPWDYDKNLKVDRNTNKPLSTVHDFDIHNDKNGIPRLFTELEWYNHDINNPATKKPPMTYEEFFVANNRYDLASRAGKEKMIHGGKDFLTGREVEPASKELIDHFTEMAKELKKQNKSVYEELTKGAIIGNQEDILVDYYFNNKKTHSGQVVRFNGKTFKEAALPRDNRLAIGSASIQKQYMFVQDTWQVNDNTIVNPILRLDHSSLFGTNATFNLGMTHNWQGDPHKRIKANIGTGYAEPGMGELYFNWEMFSSNPIAGGIGGGTARMGWYWVGNPNLKPERSINMDLGIEGEKGNTTYRAVAFHNDIKDYMSVYFTGHLLDFHPELSENTRLGGAKYAYAPDMIYSFKNIGKVSITGLETEVNHKFNNHWSGKVGYTFLHTENKSDPTMPKQLLDRPQHKVDIAINYENVKSGWSASLYGNYYIHMLDSNTLKNKGNEMTSYESEDLKADKSVIEYNFKEGEAPKYEKKTYGTWNLMVQKKWNKDKLAYIGIDNIFNHRDDDRAIQGRVLRFGINVKFGPDGQLYRVVKDQNGKERLATEMGPVKLTDFLVTPFGNNDPGIHFIGEYSAAAMWNDGIKRASIKTKIDTAIGSAENNIQDNNDKGIEQRIRAGVVAQVGDNTKITVIGSLKSNAGLDTKTTVSKNHGLNHGRLDRAEVTQRENKWDISLGRLKEKMGVTGYWFDNNLDGIRAVWTSKKTQVRIGYGSMKQSTGISDSPYNRAVYKTYMRPMTIDEFLNNDPSDANNKIKFLGYEKRYEASKDNVSDQLKLMKDLHHIVSTTYGKDLKNTDSYITINAPEQHYSYTKEFKDGSEESISNATFKPDMANMRDSAELYDSLYKLSLTNIAPLESSPADYMNTWWNKNEAKIIESYKMAFPNEISQNERFAETQYAWGLKNIENYKKDIEAKEKEYVPLEKEKDRLYAGLTDKIDILSDQAGVERVGRDFRNPNLPSKSTFTLRSYWEMNKDDLIDWADESSENKELYQAVDKLLNNYLSVADKENTEYYDLRELKNKLAQEEETVKGNTPYTSKDVKMDSIDKDKLHEGFIKNNVQENDGYNTWVARYHDALVQALKDSEQSSPYPREALGRITGVYIPAKGVVLEADNVPEIDRAAYIQVNHEITPRLGINAWYLRSTGGKNSEFVSAVNRNGEISNQVDSFDKIANVLGIGAKYQLGRGASVSAEFGKNMTALGRYLNGGTDYVYDSNKGEYNMVGHHNGNSPYFYTLRFDVGGTDYTIPGSWSAFIDYKYFQHGSFFGGNGTEFLPDRYLDGVRSFTVGGGYVPSKNLLIQASYTFGATSTGQRDTFYGPESFKLGNYSRVQMTYKF